MKISHFSMGIMIAHFLLNFSVEKICFSILSVDLILPTTVWILMLSVRYLYIQYLKRSNKWFLSKWFWSLSENMPRMALWGDRGSRIRWGLRRLQRLLQRLMVTRQLQKKWTGVSSKRSQRLQLESVEWPRWYSLDLRNSVLCRILYWNMRVAESMVVKWGKR